MSLSRFLVLLVLTIIITWLSLFMFGRNEVYLQYLDLASYAAILYGLMSVIVFLLTRKVENTKRKIIFIQLIMSNMLFKMIFSALLVIVYYKVRTPDDGIFILPFILTYVIWTVFETYFMNEQAKNR